MNEPTQHGSDTPLYPIREVSRLTGVNSVTLRAWERRYGLIRPRRTPKGHRLYAREDIERIEQILQWLNRGVPVSQVCNLIDHPGMAESDTPPPDPGDWPAQRSHLIHAVEALDTARLETLYTQTLALYPVTTCVTELWVPMLRELEERWNERPGDALQRRTLESFLRTRIGMRLYHGNANAGGPALLAMPLPDDPGTLWLLLAALLAGDRGLRVRLLDAAPPLDELPLAVARLAANGVLLAGSHAGRTDLIRRQLPRLAEQLDVPLGLCGPAARIRQAELDGSGVATLGDDLGEAISRLQALLQTT